MTHRPQDSFSRPNQTYNSLRDQLQRETTMLMQERNVPNVQRPSNQYFSNYRNIDGSPRSKITQQNNPKLSTNPIDHAKKAEIKHRIKEIIDLCRDQNTAVNRNIVGVMQTEKGIYNLLQQTDFDQTRMPPQNNVQTAPPLAYTPIRSHQQAIHPGKALQKDIRSILEQNRHIHLSEETLQLIQQIQRRSLAQIQKLRDEKLGVVRQLNEEIRRNNAEKKRNVQLQRELEFYRSNQGTGKDGLQQEGELRAKVAYLQNLLQSQQGGSLSDIPDFSLLFAQGEAIRQETLRLLKLKEAKIQGDDVEKRRLREEVDRLQRKVQQLQQYRIAGRAKTSYQVINEQYSPIAPTHKRKDSYRNSANEYQSLVMEMRKITSN